MRKVLFFQLPCFVSIDLLLVLSLLPCTAADNTTAAKFLDQREQQVKQLGDFALQNYQNSTALAETCNSPSACSRRTCGPLLSDKFKCHSIPENPDCVGPKNSTCTTVKVSWNRSFLLWPYDSDLEHEEPTCDMRSTICSQRELDNQFFLKNSQSDDFVLQGTRSFGASNGIVRSYPGREYNSSSCSTYDSRRRPWYVGATFVKKDVVVLLDYGPALGNLIPPTQPDQTFFNASKTITLRLLDTLSLNDRVAVATLANTATVVVPMTLVTETVSTVQVHTFQPIKDTISNLSAPATDSNVKANLTAGLQTALENFGNSTNLKIIIMVTAGDVVGEYLAPPLVQKLEDADVTVFTNRFLGGTTGVGKPDGQDSFTTTLQNFSCNVNNGAYFEDYYDPRNPLGSLQSFYSWVAKLRFMQNGQKPYWVPNYASYLGISSVITVAYPVFSDDFLVGVATNDILVDNLGDISADVTTLLGSRNLLNALDADAVPRIPCGQAISPRLSNCQPILNVVTGLCNDTDHKLDFKDRVCCSDSCPWRSSGGLSNAGKAAVSVGAVSAIILCAICIWLCSRYNCPAKLLMSRTRPSRPRAAPDYLPTTETPLQDLYPPTVPETENYFGNMTL